MDEVLLITGSSGIAAAVARMWAAEDPVFIFGVNENECRGLAADVAATPVTRWEMCATKRRFKRGVSACLDRFGRIDALMNVAGISARSLGDGPLHQCTAEAWDAVMDLNAKGTFLMCREVLHCGRRTARRESILNTGSVLARHPQRGPLRDRWLCGQQRSD